MRIHRTTCPACHSSQIDEVLTAEDHTVSHELFAIWHCRGCTLRFTQDVPSAWEIGPYYQSEEYVSHSNSSKGLINGLYQRVRAITLSQKLALLRETTGLETGRLLDVGCGTGEFAHTMQEAGWQVQGLEPDEGARAFAKTHYSLSVDPPEALHELTGSYDAVTLWHVLEHVHDLHDYLERLRQLIGGSGTLIIAVPNYTSPDARRYGASWAAYDVPRHLYHFSPAAMQQLLSQHDLEVREMRAMPYDGFYVSMLSEKYDGAGAIGLPRAFFSGLRTVASGRKDPRSSSSVIYVCQGK